MPTITDSRELLEELRDLLGDPYYDYSNDPADAHSEEGYEDLAEAWAELDEEDQRRVQAIREALDALPRATEDGRNSWGCVMVPEDEFEDYARQVAEEIGAINSDESWPCSHIDWEAAADALKADYATVEFDGVTYYCQ